MLVSMLATLDHSQTLLVECKTAEACYKTVQQVPTQLNRHLLYNQQLYSWPRTPQK